MLDILLKSVGLKPEDITRTIEQATELAQVVDAKLSAVEAVMPRIRDAILQIDARLASIEAKLDARATIIEAPVKD